MNDELETKGAILIHQLKSLDFTERDAEFIEHTSPAIIDKVTMLIKVITD